MSTCTNQRIGELLHAFELDQLDDEQKEAFELHLLDCAHCFEQASRFESAAHLLRHDDEVKQIVAQAAATETATTTAEPAESLWAKLRRHLWPDTNVLLRPALTYLVILALAYPAVRGLQPEESPGVRGVQSLVFSGARSASEQSASVDAPLVIMFRINNATAGQHFRVVVRSDNGTIIFSDDHFTDFNEREMGTVLIGAQSYTTGRYHIEVFASDGDTPLNRYTFSAE